MTYPTLRERTLEMIDDALLRLLAFGEVVDCVDFNLTTITMPNALPTPVGLIHIALKGVLVGTTIGNFDVVPTENISNQLFIDDRVRIGLEAIRQQKAEVLANANGG